MRAGLDAFCEAESSWLADYAFFRALMEENGNQETWDQWPEEHRTAAAAREWLAAQSPKKQNAFSEERARFYQYVQWVAFDQWMESERTRKNAGLR